ncbi:MAG: SulP family inorganic anion transporter [Gammaproteobacteria bacterium]|nr:SulP family inorganic anion transporter [Gammaproteobacteria bacterium]
MNWIGELKNPQTIIKDCLAGLTVALVLIPQSMAYAQLANLPAHYGLYASFLPVIVSALFGSSRQLQTGPVAVVSLLTAAALEPLATTNPEGYFVYAAVLALIVGIFQVSLGLLRLGVLVEFLSHSVVIGFTNAAAIIIGTSQLSKLFGVTAESGSHFYETIWNVLVEASTHTHFLTLAMGIAALVIIFGLKKFAPKIPGVLTAVVVTSLVSWLIGFEAHGGKVVGVVPEGLPSIGIPIFDMSVALDLITKGIVIAVIGYMEAISIAKAIAVQTRQRIDANQGLVGQGLGNIASGLSGAYPVAGSFSRSAVNMAAGAKTGFAAVFTGILVAVSLVLLYFSQYLYHLPQATLAAVIISAVINLIRIKQIKYAFRVHNHDGFIAVLTFVLTLILAPHLEQSIFVGVVLSLGLFMYRTMHPHITILSRAADGELRDAGSNILKTCPNISLMRFEGPLFFASAMYFEEKVLERVAAKPDLKFIIVDAEAITDIDATGEDMLHQLSLRLAALHIEFVFARTKRQVMDVFVRTGFAGPDWSDHFYRHDESAIEFAWQNINNCEEDVCPLAKEHECPAQRLTPIKLDPSKTS